MCLQALAMLTAAAALISCTPDIGSSNTSVALGVRPGELVFSGVDGRGCGAPQEVAVTSRTPTDVQWQVSGNQHWLRFSAAAGTTPEAVTVTVDCTGLAPGLHEALLSVKAGQGESIDVPARLIINPATRVTTATWKGGARGAFSVSTDDGHQSGFTELLFAGRTGTFVMNGTSSPPFYPALLESGMELGSHLVTHYCDMRNEATLRHEIEANIEGLLQLTRAPDQLISLVWPCGFTNLPYQAIAAEYFLSARGYNINQLEEPTPANLMNLKSFNSHEHEPFPPADLKSIVDAAEAQGKWANLVLHAYTNDDGAIAYSAHKDLWVAPIGEVIKYILQRDRTRITAYEGGGDAIRFSFSRLQMPRTLRHEFEAALGSGDEVTFRVDLASLPAVSAVNVGGRAVRHDVRQEGATRVLYFSARVTPQEQRAEIAFGAVAQASTTRTSADKPRAPDAYRAPPGARSVRLNYPDRSALVADGWDFLARAAKGETRDTEFSLGAALVFSPWGSLRVPADVGDLTGLSATRNSLFRDLPAGWTSVVVALDFRPLQDSQQAGVALYSSDADYVLLARELHDGHRISMTAERDGAVSAIGSQPVAEDEELLLRLDRDLRTGSVTGSFSVDRGVSWTSVGSLPAPAREPRLALITGGLQPRNARQRDNLNAPGYVYATYRAVHIVPGDGRRSTVRP